MTKAHRGHEMIMAREHLEQFRILGIQFCSECNKPRGCRVHACSSAECGGKRTKLRAPRLGDAIKQSSV
eukprot:7384612-Karenia_brevis.AAC.1